MIMSLLLIAAMVMIGCSSEEEAAPVETATKPEAPVESFHPSADDAPELIAVEDAPAVIEEGNQEVCPFSGGAIDKEIFADYEGKRVYFCLPKCIARFIRDPGGNIAKMESDGVILTTVELK